MISRRRLLAGVVAPLAFAQERDAFVDVLARLASALAAADAHAFMRWIDEGAAERERLRTLVEALLAQAEVTSSVDVKDVNAGAARADWYMEVRTRTPGTPVERRRREITVRMNGGGRITELRPIDFFAPPSPRG